MATATKSELTTKLEAFAARIRFDTRSFFRACGHGLSADQIDRESVVHIKPGRKYTKIDVYTSGKYMVENATGIIYGIKGYGKVHKGHVYGTLDIIADWNWGGYVGAHRR